MEYRTDWRINQVVTEEDLNRIEGNINTLATLPLSNDTETTNYTALHAQYEDITNVLINHTTKTGRVLIIGNLTFFANDLGASFEAMLTVENRATFSFFAQSKIYSGTGVGTDHATMNLFAIVDDLDPDTEYEFKIRGRTPDAAGLNQVRVQQRNIQVIDI